MTHDDTLIRRRIVAVQLGLLVALLMLVTGPEAVDLARSGAVQLPVLLTAVVGALLIEHRTRARPVSASS